MPHYPEGTPEHAAVKVPAIAGFGSYLVTSLALVVSLVCLIRSWRLPFGVVTGLLVGVAGLAVVLMNFAGGWVVLLRRPRAWLPTSWRGCGGWVTADAVAGCGVGLPGLLWTAQLVALHYMQGPVAGRPGRR